MNAPEPGPPDAEHRIQLALERPGGFRLAVDLALPARGVTALFGPSGSGKTTVLRSVAGLERAARGRVTIAGTDWQDDAQGLFVPGHRRPLGYVFQEASLFDHLDVAGNLRYAQRRASRDGPAIPQEALLSLLGIGHLLDRRSADLSGGERQRVAIARALASRPRLLLLDEPLAALDPARRREVLPYLQRLRDELGIPMLYVTHAMDEAARLADTLVLMDEGQVRAAGPPAEVLSRLDLPVAHEDDAGTVLEGRVGGVDAAWHLARVDFDGGALWIADPGLATGQAVRVRVLARDVSLALQAPSGSSIQNLLPCTVDAVAAGAHPSQALVRLRCGGSWLLSRLTARALDALQLAPGRAAVAQVKSAALVD